METSTGFSVRKNNLTSANRGANLTDLEFGIDSDLTNDGSFSDDLSGSPDFFLRSFGLCRNCGGEGLTTNDFENLFNGVLPTC